MTIERKNRPAENLTVGWPYGNVPLKIENTPFLANVEPPCRTLESTMVLHHNWTPINAEAQVESMREAVFDLLKMFGVVNGGLPFDVDRGQVEAVATQEYFEQFSIYGWADAVVDEVVIVANTIE